VQVVKLHVENVSGTHVRRKLGIIGGKPRIGFDWSSSVFAVFSVGVGIDSSLLRKELSDSDGLLADGTSNVDGLFGSGLVEEWRG
jgi:hypothetical protein